MRSALFLHGAGAWGGQWAIWRRMFEAEGWRVASPDLQPAIAGIAATRFADYRAQAAQAAAVMDPGFVLVGASLGGLLAMTLASDAAAASTGSALPDGPPPAPAALVLVNPLPPAPFAEAPQHQVDRVDVDQGHADRTHDTAHAMHEARRVRPWRSQGRFGSTCRALPGSSFADWWLAFRHWRDESAAVLDEAMTGIDLPALGAALVGVPALVIASDDDAEVPPSQSARLAMGLGASLLRVPGAHVDPVMGASAAVAAQSALAWIASSSPRCLAGPHAERQPFAC